MTGGPATAITRDGSWLHRMSPIPKLAWLLAVVAYALVSLAPVPLTVIIAAGLALAATAGILASVLRGLVALAPLAASIVVLQAINPTACPAACTPVAHLGPLAVTEEGVTRGLSFVARILAMEVAALVVLRTTHPSDLFAALARLRVPYVLNFMIALTFQLVPLVEREARIVLAAQRSRAMRATGLGALVPAVVPVFAGTVERMERLAVSLESRGFGSSGPRTSYRRIQFGLLDRVIAMAGLVAGILGLAASLAGGGIASPALVVPAPVAVAVFVAAVAMFVGMLIAALRAMSRV